MGRISSMVVAWAADVGVVGSRLVARRIGGLARPRLAVEAGLQDRSEAGVGAGADVEGTRAGGFEPRGAVALGQAQDADAGAEACSGCLRERMMASTRATVAGPVVCAWRRIRSCVQSAYARWLLGMWSPIVVW